MLDLQALKNRVIQGGYFAGIQPLEEDSDEQRLVVATKGGSRWMGGFSFWIASIEGRNVIGFWNPQQFAMDPSIDPGEVALYLLAAGDNAREEAVARFRLEPLEVLEE